MIELDKKEYGGTIKAPPSKSDGHRALICASLCEEGTSEIKNLYFSDDIKATMASLEALGARFIIEQDKVYVKGIKTRANEPLLDCNESGSTLRFLMPLGIQLSNNPKFITRGRLSSRPINVYQEIFEKQGIFSYKDDDSYICSGKFKSGEYVVDGSVSSQFISGLLFVLPLLKGNSKIIIKNGISSKSYLLMTLNLLKKFKIRVHFDEENNIISIKGSQKYIATSYKVENDYSQAAFFLGLGCISENPISVTGLKLSSCQADKNILTILENMGANIEITPTYIKTRKSTLKGTTISLDENPDLGPILMGLACFATSDVTFTNIRRLAIKESNRILAMTTNLEELGISTTLIDENTLIIHPGTIKEPSEVLNPFHDHRIFMTLAIITSHITCKILDENCVNKSYPSFLEELKKLEL